MASSTWNKTKSKKKYLVTALVPSETACLASSPGRRSLTAVTWQQNAFGIFRYIKSRALEENSFIVRSTIVSAKTFSICWLTVLHLWCTVIRDKRRHIAFFEGHLNQYWFHWTRNVCVKDIVSIVLKLSSPQSKS